MTSLKIRVNINVFTYSLYLLTHSDRGFTKNMSAISQNNLADIHNRHYHLPAMFGLPKVWGSQRSFGPEDENVRAAAGNTSLSSFHIWFVCVCVIIMILNHKVKVRYMKNENNWFERNLPRICKKCNDDYIRKSCLSNDIAVMIHSALFTTLIAVDQKTKNGQ